MATLVCFHAHPDDEAISTSGTMMKAKAAGHRVVLVLATRGEHGEVVEGVLEDGEQLGLRRLRETFESAAIIGCDRVEFLGYVDSGMIDEPTNHHAYSFWSADVDQAARRLAAVLDEERSQGDVVLTIYDSHGGYGHPDHIQVHRVGLRAAELAGVGRVFEATMNRDFVKTGMRMALQADPAAAADFEQQLAEIDEAEFGTIEADITHAVDVSDHVSDKQKAMLAHGSQIGPDSFFVSMPDEIFALAFGTEWFIASGESRNDRDFFTDLFD